ncbi:hypothetical protein HNR74_001269 [Flammeovirga kamogawensis]|nr:hypothetical protein [Flammeovirga kamogawensis]
MQYDKFLDNVHILVHHLNDFFIFAKLQIAIYEI